MDGMTHLSSAEAFVARRDQGWTFVAVGSDVGDSIVDAGVVVAGDAGAGRVGDIIEHEHVGQLATLANP